MEPASGTAILISASGNPAGLGQVEPPRAAFGVRSDKRIPAAAIAVAFNSAYDLAHGSNAKSE